MLHLYVPQEGERNEEEEEGPMSGDVMSRHQQKRKQGFEEYKQRRARRPHQCQVLPEAEMAELSQGYKGVAHLCALR